MKVFASARITPRWLDVLNKHFDLDHYDWAAAGRFLSPEEMIARLQGCPVLIAESDEITAQIINSAPDLAVIVDCRGTPVNIDVEAATRRGIVVINTPGRNATAVAELTVAMTVMAARNVLPAREALYSGRWHQEGKRWCYVTFQGHELYGKVAGLVGLGAIARLVAARLAAFEMSVIAYDPFVCTEDAAAIGVELVELDDLLRRADFVSLHAPLNDGTRGMISAEKIALMKPTAYFINTARADLVDEAALVEALHTGRIAGAAVDVYREEPTPPDTPLLHAPNVVAIPHLGGATCEVMDHQARIAVEGLLSLLDGKPRNVVNPAVLDAALARLGVR
jgi:D-3-phosphoglycerate dehydrogenase